MKRENRRSILLRYGVIVACILALCVRIVYKLADNTVISADKWNAKAEQSLAHVDTIQPVRGDILAADGSVLATNMIIYTPRVDFRAPRFKEQEYREAIPALADSMARYFPVRNAAEWREYLSRPIKIADKDKRPRAFTLLTKASKLDVDLLRTFPFFDKSRAVTGLHVDHEMQRVRPYGAMARRSIGATGYVGGRSIKQGIYGLEKSLDTLLAGHPGLSKKVRLTNAIVDWVDKDAVNGYDVLTTIDIKMQDIVENELNKILDICQADWGTAVLMEVGTGDIKAIANLELSPDGSGYIESLNYAVQRYEPGSVVKTLSMLVALEDGRIPNLNKVYPTGASFYVGGRSTVDCVKSDTMSLRRALEMSSNIVMSRMILEAYGNDPGRFYSRVKNTGFLEPFRTGIAEEVVPRIDSLKQTDLVSLTRQSFGYGTEISPLYTCALYNAVAGGGKFVRPRLVRGLRGNGVDSIFDVTYVRERICSEQNARELRDMLHRVVWGPRGTARSVLRSDKVDIAGKTGTANKIENGQYVKGRNRLSFCGFFPYENPRYTCMVIVAYPRQTLMSPATTSGQVVKNVAEAMYARGMLGNSSDYRSVEGPKGEYPTYYASLDNRHERVHRNIGGDQKGVMKTPPVSSKVKSTIPSVVGLSLRDALNLLEQHGYNVTYNGTGFVSGQSPAAGTSAKPGSKVVLQLRM